MKVAIVGCGRVGATLAGAFDAAGHEVIVIDQVTRAFDRLPSSFSGAAIRGDGTDEDVLRRAGVEGADVFLSFTEGDNRNAMAAQLAQEAFDVPRVVAKINDPLRAEAYAEMGLATICRTTLLADAVNAYLGMPTTGPAGVIAPRGAHGGDGHAAGEAMATAAPKPAQDGEG